ncbi:MAG TPA: hypothetical protein VMF64_03390 [Steroidobacteraceae bacterium]|nr:hypothetical protein [Steroidobacteraceae bacterium]
MSRPNCDLDDQVAEKLYAAYRSSIKDPPYGARDHALLRAAAGSVPSRWPRPLTWAALTLMVAVLGILIAIPPSHVLQRMARISAGGNITPQGGVDASRVAGLLPKAGLEAQKHELEDQNLLRTQTDASLKSPPDDYLIDAMFGPAWARERQSAQAALALQLSAESQDAMLAMQAEEIETNLYDMTMELERNAPRLQPGPPSVRRYR